jgi:DNA-binding NtrC family response regulator
MWVSFRTLCKKITTERRQKVNTALLEYKMKENGKSISDMCEMLGISRSAFYRKCNGKSEFTQSEIQKIVDYLNLDSPVEIFFAR